MLSLEKCYSSPGMDGFAESRWKGEVVPKFRSDYVKAGKPNGMALFILTVEGYAVFFMTPESSRHCASVLKLFSWDESNPLRDGPRQWLAGDESQKPI